LLAALMHAVPGPVAEKVLASVYVLSFGAALWYFLGAFGAGTRRLWPVGMLFVFNFCLLMGFYNYCLTVPGVLFVLGFCLRHGCLGWSAAGLLAGVLVGLYFTHLVGYLVALGSAFWVVATGGSSRAGSGAGSVQSISADEAPAAEPMAVSRARAKAGSLMRLSLAALPSAALLVEYLARTGFFTHAYWSGMLRDLRWQWGGDRWLEHLEQWLLKLNDHFYGAYERWVPLGCFVLLLLEALTVATLLAPAAAVSGGERPLRRWPVAVLAILLTALYFVVPNDWQDQGGYLKCRLALLVPLLWLGCLCAHPMAAVRLSFNLATYVLLALNLAMLYCYCREANAALAEYTSGVDRVGRNRVLFVAQEQHMGRPLVQPLEHAADYYCLTTGNVNLDNYQADKAYFPVRFRPGIERGRGDLFTYRNRDVVDVVIVWGRLVPTSVRRLEREYREIYRRGQLRIFERRVREQQAEGGNLSSER